MQKPLLEFPKEKEEKMMNQEDIQILMQLLDSLEESASELEKAYESRDKEKFNRAENQAFDLQKKIAEVLK